MARAFPSGTSQFAVRTSVDVQSLPEHCFSSRKLYDADLTFAMAGRWKFDGK
jgi:hypothetical protein